MSEPEQARYRYPLPLAVRQRLWERTWERLLGLRELGRSVEDGTRDDAEAAENAPSSDDPPD